MEHLHSQSHSPQTPTAGQRPPAVLWAAVLLFTALALAVRLYHLDYRGMWTDEFHTLDAILRPLPDLVADRLAAGHLPLYFMGLREWHLLFGSEEWWLRLPSALTGFLLVPCAALFAWRRLPMRHTLYLLALATFNGTAVWASQEMRPYAIITVASCLAHHAYLRSVEDPRLRHWLLYALMMGIGMASQPIVALLALGHFVFSIRERRASPVHFRHAARVIILLLAVLIPAGYYFASVQDKFAETRFAIPPIDRLLNRLGLICFGMDGPLPKFRGLCTIVFTLCLAGIAYGVWRARGNRAPEALPSRLTLRFCMTAAGVPIAAIYIFGFFFSNVVGPERYFLPVAVPLWVLVIWGIRAMPVVLRRGVASAAVVLVAFGLVGQWSDRGTGLREMAASLRSLGRPGDIVIIQSTGSMAIGLRYYEVGLPIYPIKPKDDAPQIRDEAERALEGRERAWIVFYRDKQDRLTEIFAGEGAFDVATVSTFGAARLVLVNRIKP